MTINPLLAIATIVGGCGAFQVTTTPRAALYSARQQPLCAVKFDKSSDRWITDDPANEGPEGGYNIIGSLYRGLSTATHTSRYVVLPGLSCCVGIDLQGDDILLYSIFFYPPKGVLKYMAQQDCSRMNGAPVKDYANANMSTKQVFLSSIWACVVLCFAYDLITGVGDGRYGRSTGDLFHGNLWSLPF
ncbi:hypothetical protein THAOC_09818 [Thalassiosira oceanica]|uniref:Uncharacterized protein n=1 Tax=Thalassiosira oceanica TaxID=159749 RepID=K0T6K9_THAOC|nr:hypothetical protein THAOC_09818 [Thalassiosira oceanica]|eukprot:EJK68966.1 hypothetical protein THAOC_09818 [Thalassiosira oceanica]